MLYHSFSSLEASGKSSDYIETLMPWGSSGILERTHAGSIFTEFQLHALLSSIWLDTSPSDSFYILLLVPESFLNPLPFKCWLSCPESLGIMEIMGPPWSFSDIWPAVTVTGASPLGLFWNADQRFHFIILHTLVWNYGQGFPFRTRSRFKSWIYPLMHSRQVLCPLWTSNSLSIKWGQSSCSGMDLWW